MMAIKIEDSVIMLFLFSLFEFLFFIPILIYTLIKKRNFSQYIKNLIYNNLKNKKTPIFILVSISIAISMIFIAPYIIYLSEILFLIVFGEELLQQSQENLNEFITMIQNPVDVFLIIIMCFFVIALSEELFFRGFLQDSIKSSKKWRIILSATFFSLYHLITSFNLFSIIYMFGYYFIWGIILSLEFYFCRKQLIFPILTHGLFDLITFFI
ncbi:MAG: CPBP family intramembrane glutamic endopeptidase [Candidatus Helarchaeota archaeon]